MSEDADASGGRTCFGSAALTNEVGLHARPSVRLTSAARRFRSDIEIACNPDGPWVDAKSPVQTMRFKATTGSELFFRATGSDAEAAVAHLVGLVHRQFGEDPSDAGEG